MILSPIVDGKEKWYSLFKKQFCTFSFFHVNHIFRASLVAQMIKNSPATQETWVSFLGWEDPLRGGSGNQLQYSCLQNSIDREEPGGLQSTGHRESDKTKRLTTHNHIFIKLVIKPTSRYSLLKRNKNICPYKTQIFTASLFMTTKHLQQPNWLSTERKIEKWIIVYPYHEILQNTLKNELLINADGLISEMLH